MAAESVVGDGPASIALVDLSYLFKKEWHSPAAKESPEAAATNTLARLAGVRESVEHVIVCLDAPPYLRKQIDPEYKAQRDKPTDGEVSWKKWLLERIERDGYRIAKAKGHEADDVIATLCKAYWWCPDVRIIGADKDCAQCVTENVRMFVPSVGERPAEVRGPAEIRAKYGVATKDMGLWLALVGDTSDNIRGVPGVGAKKAAELIQNCVNVIGIGEAMADAVSEPKPAKMWTTLAAHWEDLQLGLKLTKLVDDLPLDTKELLDKREPQRLVEDDVGEIADAMIDEAIGRLPSAEQRVSEADFDPISKAPEGYVAPAPETAARAKSEPPKMALAKTTALVTEDLQPLDVDSAWRMAKGLYNGRLYGKFPSVEAVFTIIVKARELGLKVTTALDGFHVIEGKPSASADMMRALAERHPDCEYFRIIDSGPESATWETKHRRHPEPTRYTYTIVEARQAGLQGGNWAKRPRDMLTKTAASKLARLVYPGATVGLYCPEEMGDAA